MKTAMYLGVWMDHSSANLMEYTIDPIKTRKLESSFTYEAKKETLGRSEKTMHNKEQQQTHEFYKQIGAIILGYTGVILFGPTNAKEELMHVLQADHRFAQILIHTEHADKMTENQQHAFVKDYFSKRNLNVVPWSVL